MIGLTRRAALALAVPGPDWQPLFDGRSFAGWTLGDGAPVSHSWTIENGAIATIAGTRGRSDLLCAVPLRAFELEFEFRLSAGSNTGVKYFVQQMLRYLNPGSALSGSYGAVGLEFQLATDDAEGVHDPNQRLGALYGLLPAQTAPTWAVDTWASARLVCRPGACEHWINSRRVLAFDPASPAFKRALEHAATDPAHSIVGATAALVAARRKTGPLPPAFLALQHHASPAWFRSLRVRALT